MEWIFLLNLINTTICVARPYILRMVNLRLSSRRSSSERSGAWLAMSKPQAPCLRCGVVSSSTVHQRMPHPSAIVGGFRCRPGQLSVALMTSRAFVASLRGALRIPDHSGVCRSMPRHKSGRCRTSSGPHGGRPDLLHQKIPVVRGDSVAHGLAAVINSAARPLP